MADSSTLTVRLSTHTKNQLATLAGHTHRTRSFLAAEAIANYVSRELAMVEAIEHGRADVQAGRVKSHEEVTRQAHAVIKAARVSG